MLLKDNGIGTLLKNRTIGNRKIKALRNLKVEVAFGEEEGNPLFKKNNVLIVTSQITLFMSVMLHMNSLHGKNKELSMLLTSRKRT